MTNQNLEKMLRVYRHEIQHLISGLSLPIDYLGRDDLKQIDDVKIKSVYQDAQDTINMISFMAKNIDVLLNEDFKSSKQEFNIYKLLLYKWENIFRKDAQSKYITFMFLKEKLELYSDPRFVELLVYNLFSNAVKYAFRGSKIYFDCRRDRNTGKVIFSIVNYAAKIPKNVLDDLFEFGVSYKGMNGENTPGSGIGLFIVKQIMKKLGGCIQIKEPRFISTYNVPMHFALMNREDVNAEEDIENLQDAYRRLCTMKIDNLFGEKVNGLDLVINDDFRKIGFRDIDPEDIYLWLNIPTYEIQFEVYF